MNKSDKKICKKKTEKREKKMGIDKIIKEDGKET